MVVFYFWVIKARLDNTLCGLWSLQTLVQTQPDCKEFSTRSYFFTKTLKFFRFPTWPTKAKKITPVAENKPLIYQPKEAVGSPEKAGQCCHFQSDWHWAVSLHSTVHDSALVANTGSSVTAAVQSKIVWKHEWMIWFTKKVMFTVSDACHEKDVKWVDRWDNETGKLAFGKQLKGTQHL